MKRTWAPNARDIDITTSVGERPLQCFVPPLPPSLLMLPHILRQLSLPLIEPEPGHSSNSMRAAEYFRRLFRLKGSSDSWITDTTTCQDIALRIIRSLKALGNKKQRFRRQVLQYSQTTHEALFSTSPRKSLICRLDIRELKQKETGSLRPREQVMHIPRLTTISGSMALKDMRDNCACLKLAN